ncbi:disease resistance protein RPV1-like isoform X5 [Syzygium oleosum]|uniref:disease resistance protein RPV1-like isoform X5 n=1 Tax=Syzygium oleosum TaxID=219896 RepID=UPI0024BBD061|nr:disease resistance protein RPV1-like isoform X5 [Syzygium oleosum]
MAEYDVYNLEMGEDEPARLDQSKGERSKVEAVRLAEIARTRLIAAHDVQVKRKQVMMKSVAAESSYDVFLSFSGSENPFGFAHSLHRRLQAGGLLVFRDDAPLRTPKELPTRVYSSKIYVPIFTGTYGYSPWCLESLALMAEHASRSGGKEEVRPVFYNRGPSDVKLETPIYRDAVDMLRRTWGAEKVERWKKALVEAGKIKGWELRSYKSVGELITSIVRGIWLKLQLGRDVVPEHLSTHAEPVSSDIESDKLSIGAQPLSAIDPENLFTGAVPLNTNIVPEDIVTGSDPLKVKGNRTNEQAHAKAGIQGPVLSYGTSATSKWSLIRSVFAVLYLLRRIRNREFCGFVSSLDGMHEVNDCVGGTSVEARSKHRFQRLALSSGTYSTSATSRWSLIRPVVTFLCFLFRLQRIRNRVYRRIFSLSGMHGVNDGVGGTSVEGTDHLNTIMAGFEILPSKTFLSLGCANIGGRFADALLNVRWLHWQGCPRDCEAISIHLENLLIVDLSWSMVTESWGGWKGIKMECLKVLNLTGCAGLLVTPSFSCYPNLEILILERCSRLVHLDPSINDLKLLVTLNLKFCSELSMLPVEMDGMNALEELLIDGTSVRELPASIGKLVQLQILSATNCFSLVQLPGSVSELKTLSVLALDNAKVLELPDSIGDLGELRRLSLRDCRGLGKLPESIGKLEDSLVELDISGTGISKLPDSTKHLQSLKVLKMDSCFLREFPSYIGELINLEEIHASWCRSLEGVIPSDIRKLDRLRELRLRCTRISSLPSEIQFMSSLQTLDLLHCNILEELPRLPSTLIDLYINPGLMQNM